MCIRVVVCVCWSDICTLSVLCLLLLLCWVPGQPCVSLCAINQPGSGGPCIKQMDWPDRWGPVCHLLNLAWPAMWPTLQVKADGWIMAVVPLQEQLDLSLNWARTGPDTAAVWRRSRNGFNITFSWIHTHTHTYTDVKH